MSIELKIKAMSLAAEARIIRREEHIAKKRGQRELNRTLHLHRVNEVRKSARSTHLARGFIRGTAYRRIEATCYLAPKEEKVLRLEVLRLLEKYGAPEFRNQTKGEREAALNAWFERT